MDFNLSGKVAIVTGGGSGLGASISEVLAQEGAHVIVNYIADEENVIKFVESLNDKYENKAIAVYGDISDEKDINSLFDKAGEVYGKADILVNCAGIWPKSYVKDMPVEEFRKTIKVNLEGPFILSKKMVNHLIERNAKGKIVNVVSQAAFHGSTSGHAHYAASKGGLVTFTISLAREVAKHGINVTAVAPGIMKTPMVGDNVEDRYLERIPLGRISDPKEVAYSVAFLASDKADYITGATIDVTGGMLMR